MRPERSWKPSVTVEIQVDEHHTHENILGVDGQKSNQKEVFNLCVLFFFFFFFFLLRLLWPFKLYIYFLLQRSRNPSFDSPSYRLASARKVKEIQKDPEKPCIASGGVIVSRNY